MKTDIILAGVGGQGILSIAAAIGSAALTNNLYLKQAETHGMSQRGGDVQSFLRLSDAPIYSDLIPIGGADLILSVEPMEALRYLPYLKPDGYVVTNTVPFINIPNYPETTSVISKIESLPHHVLIDADSIARDEVGNVRLSGRRYRSYFQPQRTRGGGYEPQGSECRTRVCPPIRSREIKGKGKSLPLFA